MIRRRGGPPQEEESSSEEEDDAFSALSSQNKKTIKTPAAKPKTATDTSVASTENNITSKPPASLPVKNTSSMKRHHGMTDSRKAKMDALLQELQVDNASASQRQRSFVPEKKGSFVQPGEEHLTTNIFVGNLAPSITEEMMIDLFRQFGDLYSLKIMWPRTPEERARNRHTGFVCFMNREDAEDAMEACAETDPFNVGRRLMMRWGKNVKQVTGGAAPFATKLGGSSVPDAKKPRLGEGSTQSSAIDKASNEYNPATHGIDAIRVIAPKDPERARFITTIASFVAKDGSLLEQRLILKEAGNPKFDFLTYSESNEHQREEHIFYKWRVYSFCQGDGFDTWRTEPFIMLKDNGKHWVPPPVDRAAAMREEQAAMEREQRIRQQKAQRRRMLGRKDFMMTGRQLEQAKYGKSSGGAADGSATLTDNEMKDFHSLTREKLCISREAVCNAMAYCFEKSGAAKQISQLLKGLLVDDSPGVSVDTRIARLYLLSDVLYNSQQPGVRNAFLYRDAIERMAPDVFESLGKHGEGKIGRMTFMKLKTAVSAILSAWTNWSVYNPVFIDELEARFDGRELPSAKLEETTPKEEGNDEEGPPPSEPEKPDDVADRVTVTGPRGDWKDVTDEPSAPPAPVEDGGDATPSKSFEEKETTEETTMIDAESDVDGEPLEDDDLDGQSLSDEDMIVGNTDENTRQYGSLAGDQDVEHGELDS